MSFLGAAGMLGSSRLGAAANQVSVNAASGNLVVQATDQVLLGLGPSDIIARTYNSLGTLSDNNGAQWSDAASRHVLVSSLTGTANTAGSTIQRVAADGSVATYTYSTTAGAYVANEGGGAYDTLTYNSGANQWTWTDGSSQGTEVYDAANGGRIVSVTDHTGYNTEHYTYNSSGLLAAVVTAGPVLTSFGGEATTFTYNAANEIESIQTYLADGSTPTQVYYNYDSLGRLTSATIDLSPADSSTSDGNVYVTTYAYNGTTNQLSSITQSDGSQLQITYDGDGKVASVVQAQTSSANSTDSFAYGSGSTTVTDNNGDVSTLGYDSSGELTSLESPEGQTSHFTYDAMGNVLTATQANGATTTYTYDANGNRLTSVDSLGNTQVSTYSATNQRLTFTQFVAPAVGGAAAAQPLTTQFVYSTDGQDNLRFMISPNGEITEYQYNEAPTPGLLTSVLQYPASTPSPPLAGDLSTAVAASGATTLALPLLGGGASSLAVTTAASHGTVTISGTAITYTPDLGYSGSDTFQYAATNAYGTSAPATVTVNTSAQPTTSSYSLAALQAWGAADWNKSTIVRTESTYDLRGQRNYSETESSVLSSGDTYYYDFANRTYYSYDSQGDLLSEHDYNSSVLNTFDALGRVTSTTNAMGATTTFAYANNATGSTVTATNGANGHVTTSTFNLADQLVSTSDSTYSGATTTYAYDTLGELRMVTDPAGVSSYFVYDSDGRKVADVSADGSITTYVYNADDQLTQTVQHGAKLTSGQLALLSVAGTPAPVALGDVLPAASGGDEVSYAIYDADGRLAETIDAKGAAVTYAYDGASRLTSTTRFAEPIASGVLAGFLSTPPTSPVTPTADPDRDVETTHAYDADGRMIQSVVDPGGLSLTSTTTYDAFGNVVATTDPTGDVTRYVYDGANRLIYEISPEGAVTQTAYDGDGDVVSTTAYATPIGPSTLAALPLSTSLAAVAAAVTSSSADRVTDYAYDAHGLIQTTSDVTGQHLVTTDTYDGLGELIAVTQPTGRIVRYAYNSDGQRIFAIDGAGDVVQTTYAANGQVLSTDAFAAPISAADLADLTPSAMASMSPPDLAAAIGADVTTGASDRVTHDVYDAKGQLAYVVDATGEVTEYDYDAFGRVVQTTAFGQTISPSTFTFAAIQAAVSSQVGSAANSTVRTVYGATGEVAFTIDADGQVTGFIHDALGNLADQTSYGALFTASGPQTFADLQTWTAANAGADDRTDRFVYDQAGREIYAIDPAGAVTEMTYDADGHVVATTAFATALTPAQLAALPVLAEAADITAVLTSSGGDQISRAAYNAAGQRVFSVDPAGSVTAFTYDAFGEIVGSDAYATPIAAGTLAALPLQVSAATIAAAVSTSGADQISHDVYNTAGELAYSVDAIGRVTEFDYDGSGRMVQTIVYTNPIAPSSYAYGAVHDAISGSSSDRVTRTVYNDAGEVAYQIDAAGGVTGYTYDTAGRVAQQTRYATLFTSGGLQTLSSLLGWAAANAASADRVSRFVYDGDGREVYAIDAAGDVLQTAYDAKGDQVAVTAFATPLSAAQLAALSPVATADEVDADLVATSSDEISRYVYDASGRLIFSIDALGGVTQTTYDSRGEVTGVRVYATSLASGVLAALPLQVSPSAIAAAVTPSAADHTTRYVYDSDGRLLFTVDTLGNVKANAYNALGQVLSTTAYATPLTSAQLSALPLAPSAGDIAAVLSPSSDDETTAYNYDIDGRVLTTTDAQGGVTTNVYDAFGNTVSVTDPRGVTGYFYYDALNRQVMQVDPNGYATVTAYSSGDQITEVDRYQTQATGTGSPWTRPTVDAGGGVEVTLIGRDGLDRVVSNTDANGYIQTYTLDAFGDRVSVTNQTGGTTTNAYDARGLMVSQTLSNASDLAGGTVTSPFVDVEATSVTNLFTYDAFGNRTSEVEAAGLSEARTTHYAYDALNRQTAQSGDALTVTAVDPTTGTISTSTVTPTQTIAYDVFGNVTQTVDADGHKTFFYYDALNRKVAQVDAAGTLSTWTYDAFNDVATARVYGDAVALPSSPGGAAPAPVDAANYRETTYAYDRDNRQTQASVQNALAGRFIDGVYQSITTALTTTTVYDASGNVVRTTDPADNSVRYYYDSAGRKIAQLDQDNYLTTYALDNEGNVLTETQYANAVSGTVTDSTSLSTLLAGISSDASDRITDFTYDKDGQRLTETREGVEATTVNDLGEITTAPVNSTITYTYNGLGEVTSETQATGDFVDYIYDANGRMSEMYTTPYASGDGPTVTPTTLYFYDGLNNLTMTAVSGNAYVASNEHITQNVYGAGGRLTSTTDATGFQQNFGYDADGDVIAKTYERLQPGGAPILEADTYQLDAKGRTVASSVADYNGSTWNFGDISQTSYDAYGEVTSKGVNGGAQESFEYDGAGRLIGSNANGGSQSLFVDDADGNQTLEIDSAGTSLSGLSLATAMGLVLDGSGAPIEASGVTATFKTYDGRSSLFQTIQPFRQLNQDITGSTATLVDTKGYDAFGDIVQDTNAAGAVTQYSFDALGDLVLQTDPLVASTSASGVTTDVNPAYAYFFDASGRQVASEDANGNITSQALLAGFGYNGSSAKVISQYNPDGGTTSNGYDVYGNVEFATDALGDTTTYSYDGVNRLVDQTTGVSRPITMYGTSGNDLFDGGTYEQGNGGNDVFDYTKGYGKLEINQDGGTGVLQTGVGITADNLAVTADDAGDLYITDGTAGDVVKIDHAIPSSIFSGSETGIDYILLYDNTHVTRDQLIAMETTGSKLNETTLYGTHAADTFDSKGYANVIEGNGGADTIVYDAGYRQLEINEDVGYGDTSAATIAFGAGITASDLTVTNDGSGNMIVTDGVVGDKIMLDGEFNNGPFGTPEFGVGEVTFSDGSSLSRADLLALAATGSPVSTSISGTRGDDTLDSRGYATYAQGNGGSDTFIYDPGYNALEINADAGYGSTSSSVLNFGPGVTASDLTISNDGSGNMIISDGTLGDRITVDGEFNNGPFGTPEYGVAEIDFSDGSSLTRAQAIALTTTGSVLNTKLYGSRGDDVFDSQGFAQYAQGNGGADSYVYSSGYGQLEINADAGYGDISTSTLDFGAGITASDLSVVDDGSGNMIITDGTAGDRIVVDGEFAYGPFGTAEYGVDAVTFSDGSSLTTAQLKDMSTIGSAVNTRLYGSRDANTLDSEGFARYAQGVGGNDTYVYNAGYGALEINDDSNGAFDPSASILEMGAGLSASSLRVTNDGSGDMILTDGVLGDRIVLDGEYNRSWAGQTEYGVSEIDFSDGSSISRADLIAATVTTGSTTEYDGTSAAETFDHSGSAYEVGNGGADTFVFDEGYGAVEINEAAGWGSSSSAVLDLGSGLTTADLAVSSDRFGDMILTDTTGGDQIKVDGEFNTDGTGATEYGVSEVDLSGGTVLTRADLIALATTGSAANTTLYGTSGANSFDSEGHATYAQGNGGADTFAYDEGYGQLEINEDAGWGTATSAVLTMGAGLTSSDISVTGDSAGDMFITDGTFGDRIKIDSEFTSGGAGAAEFGVGEVDFSDGSSLTRAQLIDLSTTASAVNSKLYGTGGANTFDGGSFARYEQGNGGSDTFLYDAGDRNLELNNDAGWGVTSASVLSLGSGLSASSLSVAGDSTGDMILTDGVTGDQIKVDGEFNLGGAGAAEFGISEIDFSDGSSLTRSDLAALALTGSPGNTRLYGGSGDDTFHSDGYAHYDQGNGGTDTFVYGSGEGQLEISEYAGYGVAASSVLELGPGLTASNINLASDSAGDLIVTDTVTGDRVKVDNGMQFAWGVSEIDFSDGSSLSSADIHTFIDTGSPVNTVLYGTGADDTFNGEGYARYQLGNGGTDTFNYDAGQGPVEISEYAGYGVASGSILKMGSGVTDGAFTVSEDTHGDIILMDDADGDRIQLDGEANDIYMGTSSFGVSEVDFSDGFKLSRDQLIALATPQGALTTTYAYDGLGQRIATSNSELGSGVQATTTYDGEGRVTQQTDLDGLATTYAYTYDAGLETSGLGTFGGDVVTETNSSGLTSTTDRDYFGRTVGSTDFGGDVYADTFDAAGRQIVQTMTNGSGTLATTTDNTFYNTGALAETAVTFGWATDGIASTDSTYSYDVEGNRLTETYTGSTGGMSPTITSYEDAASTYDALNRMVSYTDTGAGGAMPVSITYAYDTDSNVRNMVTTSVNLTGGGTTTQDYWYLYDAMNRFTTAQGALVGGSIVRGSAGTDITYNKAGERASATTTQSEVYHAGTSYVSYNDNHIETFTYSPGGYLSTVSISDGTYNASTGTVDQGGAYLAGVDVRDEMGRVVDYVEYTTDGKIYYSAESNYDADSNLTVQISATAESDGTTLVATTNYDYRLDDGGVYSGAYEGGVVTHSHENWHTISDDVEGPDTTSDTNTSYVWNTTTQETGITYESSANPGLVQTTAFSYDAANHLSSVTIDDGTPSTVAYTTNGSGEVLSRIESSSAASNPQSYYYFFDGQQVGDVTNDGSAQTEDYAAAINARSQNAVAGLFADGTTSPTAYAGFGDAYQPITPMSQGSSSQANANYTVQAGDTLASIAQAQWGDSSLWYLIADANGFSGNVSLTAGTSIVVPSKVTNVHNSSATFAVYDPNQALGNVQPLNPPPSGGGGGGGGCGVFGEILEVIVATVVAKLVTGVLDSFGVDPQVSGAIGNAIGDIVGQGVGLLTGAQSKFNWTEVGTAAINGYETAGADITTPENVFDAVVQRAASDVVSQGVALATGAQRRFDWAQLATSSVEAGVEYEGAQIGADNKTPQYETAGLTGVAAAIAGGATRAAITGQSFGRSVEDELPGTVGATIGSVIANNVTSRAVSAIKGWTAGGSYQGGGIDSGSSSADLVITPPSDPGIAPLPNPTLAPNPGYEPLVQQLPPDLSYDTADANGYETDSFDSSSPAIDNPALAGTSLWINNSPAGGILAHNISDVVLLSPPGPTARLAFNDNGVPFDVTLGVPVPGYNVALKGDGVFSRSLDSNATNEPGGLNSRLVSLVDYEGAAYQTPGIQAGLDLDTNGGYVPGKTFGGLSVEDLSPDALSNLRLSQEQFASSTNSYANSVVNPQLAGIGLGAIGAGIGGGAAYFYFGLSAALGGAAEATASGAPLLLRDSEPVPVGPANPIENGVIAAAKVFTSADPLVGELATAIEHANPGSVNGVNLTLESTVQGEPAREVDILLHSGDVIEVTEGSGVGKATQMLNQQRLEGVSGEVMLYSPNVGKFAAQSVQNSGFKVFTDKSELIQYLAGKAGR